jgi:competence protein ComFC
MANYLDLKEKGCWYQIKNVISIILDYIYPKNIKCILCNNPIDKNNTYSLCKSCFDNISFIKDGCIKCGKPIENNSSISAIDECSYCSDKDFYFKKAISCIEYDETTSKLIYNLKYGRKTYISYHMAQIIRDKLKYENINFDFIVYVPLHKSRYKKRGFNQCELIAKNLENFTNKKVINCLYRKNKTRYLSKLSKNERSKELRGAFKVKDDIKEIYNKNILLIDDILTTGSTVNEISRLLKDNNVNNIYVCCVLTGRNLY